MNKGNALKTVLIFLVIALAVVFVLSIIVRNDEKTFTVTVGGTTYDADTSGVVISSKTEIKFNSVSKDTNLSIYAAESKTDLSFDINGDVYAWNDLVNAQKELSAGFNVTETKNGYSLSFINLSTLLSDVFGTPVSVLGDSSTVLFVMHLTDGNSVIKLTFSAEFIIPVENIKFNLNTIIFE